MNNNQSMKDRIIRQVETEINGLSEKRDELYSEIEKIEERISNVESEMADARSLLVFLKTGKKVNVQAVPGEKKKRRSPKTDAQYREAIIDFGTRKFTSRHLAEKLDVSPDAAQNKLKYLAREGFIFIATPSKMGQGGRTPTEYLVTS